MAASTTHTVDFADAEVSWGKIKAFCAMLEDPNPSYWDSDFAGTAWGGIISPPALLFSWVLPLPWRPDGTGWDTVAPLLLRVDVPGDTVINVAVESVFTRPIRVGDVLVMEQDVVDVSDEKQTRLGPGRFITTFATFRNQRGDVVGTDRNVLLRYASQARALEAEPAAAGGISPELGEPMTETKLQQYWDDIVEGDAVAPITMDVTYSKVAMIMGTTSDYFPGHHDPEYARSQGQENIYVNTIFFQGFIDRLLTTWAGPATFIMARTFRMHRSIYPGDMIYSRGTVKACRPVDELTGIVEVEVQVGRQDGACASASATLRLPRRPRG